jgi:CheY-like chemotaxis protein
MPTLGDEPTKPLVFVVDDEAIVRLVVRRVLEKAGFHVVEAEDGPGALAGFRERATEIAVVLLDLNLPGVSGADVFRQILRIRPTAKVIIASGRAADEVAAELGFPAPAHVLEKPFHADELIPIVQKLCSDG